MRSVSQSIHENDFMEILKNSLMINTFHSNSMTLLRVLIRILFMSGIAEKLGCEGTFRDGKNHKIEANSGMKGYLTCDKDYDILMGSIYFSQMIMCASCCPNDESTAPRKIDELGPMHRKCIEAQLELIDSFDEQVDLTISLGKINDDIINKLDAKGVIKNKCKNHINISHPTTSGWNKIDLMNLEREQFKNWMRIERSQAYITSSLNCYDQLAALKRLVERLILTNVQ